jgi:hypothetical protein
MVSEKLDKIAEELQGVNPEMALALDRISDRLEGRKASDEAIYSQKTIDHMQKTAEGYAKAYGHLIGTIKTPIAMGLRFLKNEIKSLPSDETPEEIDRRCSSFVKRIEDLEKTLEQALKGAQELIPGATKVEPVKIPGGV